MKLIIATLALALSPAAFAAPTITLTGTCLNKVEAEIDATKDDDGSCIKGASVDSVDEVNGTTYSLSFSRFVCEGYDSGSADVVLENVVQTQTAQGTEISGCAVKTVTITDESAD